MPDFLDEVRAEVRNDRFFALFDAYKYHLLAAAVTLVVATGISSWYSAHRIAKQEAAGAQFMEAHSYFTKGDMISALPRFNATIEKGTQGWKSLAMLERASMLIDQKKYNEAKQAYEEIIADSAADVLFRDYAAIMSAWLMMEHGTGDADTISKWLESMSGTDKPWRFSARELLGLFALKQGDNAKAREIFTALKDEPLAPTHMQERAVQMLAGLPAETKTKKE